MLEIEKWAIGKPFFLSLICQQCVLSIDAVCEFSTALKNDDRSLERNFNLTSVEEWLKLYKDHNRILEFFVMFFLEYSVFGKLRGTKYEDIFFEILDIIPEDSKQFTPKLMKKIQKKALPLLNEINRLNSIEITTDINNDVDEDLRESFKSKILSMPEAAFFFLIWAPSHLFFLQSPTKLFFLARNGDVNALEKLISLDSSVVAEKRIANQLHLLRTQGKRTDYEKVMRALNKKPDIPTTTKTLKYRMAGLMSSLSIASKNRLTAPAIRKLFDALARDRGLGLVDLDIPDTPDSFTRRIYDQRGFWKPIFNPDKQ